ncbi:very long-chain-fatty-acid--CoA ligase bubblegum [Schistocerca piceifrons]|uniref:very long-chain-fatty-acid--CoA ligase bubblegum n=1 Tax=Schistocerca piceifrons TaxID=274613 RepID=UPI001F5E9D41|nr:very long-chain-fatty-acid--CoA ligase bubblegum [Schistocerca piceifrons]
MEVNVITTSGGISAAESSRLVEEAASKMNGHSRSHTVVSEHRTCSSSSSIVTASTTVLRSQLSRGKLNGIREPKTVQISEEKPVAQPPDARDQADQEFHNGPNQVLPADSYTTTRPDCRVKLRSKATGIAAREPISVPGLLHRAVELFPELTAMATRNDDGTWNTITYEDYEFYVRSCAKAFIKLGLERHHSVCILGFNSPEWFIADLAAIYAGGIAAGIYTTNSPEACLHCAINSRANIFVVQDKKQLDKVLQIRSQIPHLKAIVQYEGKPEEEGVLSWDDVITLGNAEDDVELDKILSTLAVNECCTLIYTSGTVGNPKGVMLSHDNLTWTAHCTGSRLDLANGEDSLVSYLPLSHIAAQIVDIYVSMSYAVAVYFADKDALKGSLIQTLKEVRPTQFVGVPRVWEKISEQMTKVGAETTGIRKTIASWAKSQGIQHNLDLMNGVHYNSIWYMMASMLVFKKVKRLLGFDRCQNFFSAAAPLSNDVKKYLMSLDIPVMEVFGMSECSGPHTLAMSRNFRLESVGKALPGLETKLHNEDEEGEGEICLWGRHVCMGYLSDPEKTSEAIDEEGWLHSGDLGTIDESGFVYITGRLKELIITAGGENVPPVLLEQTLKTELPCISHAVIIGERRKFLSVLITMKTEIEKETGEPLDELDAIARRWCKTHGSTAKTVSEILKGPDQKVMEGIQKGIDRANEKAISNAQRIQKFAILEKDFSLQGGELGPTMKVKRNVVAEKYADVIERFYKGT